MKKILILTIICLFLGGCGQESRQTKNIPQTAETNQVPTMKSLKDKKILFVAVPNFRDSELIIPRNILSQAGAEIHITSLAKGNFSGNEDTTIEAEFSLEDVNPLIFDAVIFIGGPGMTRELENKELQILAKKFYDAEKLTTAICIAPAVLGKAGILKNKKATVFPTGQGYLIEGGADYTAKAVEKDGRLITADGPESAAAFANEIINYFK